MYFIVHRHKNNTTDMRVQKVIIGTTGTANGM